MTGSTGAQTPTAPPPLPEPARPATPLIAPSAQWTGKAGSGFAESGVPLDPERTASKAICRLLTPPGQYFTDSVLVGVIAGANDGGSLWDNLGIKVVRAHYEGETVNCRFGFETFPDANGQMRTYLGWWARLEHDGRHGHAQVYFEAVPNDPAILPRVMGPYQYSPQPEIYTRTVEIAPSQPVVAGQSYQDLQSAIHWMKANRAACGGNPRILFKEASPSGYYWCDPHGGTPWNPEGYFNIEAEVPIVIGIEPGRERDYLRWGINKLHLRGENVLVDFENVSEIYIEGGNAPHGGEHWLDGCVLENRAGRASLWNGGARPVAHTVRGWGYSTEAYFEGLDNAATGMALVRGCTLEAGYNDAINGSLCVVGTGVHNHHSDFFRDDRTPAFRVSYDGAASTATINKASWEWDTDVALREDGEVVDRIKIWKHAPSNDAKRRNADADGNIYFLENLAERINRNAGWHAEVLPRGEGWNAGYLGKLGAMSGHEPRDNWGKIAHVDVAGRSVEFAVYSDLHSDWYQKSSTGNTWAHENIVIYGNTGVEIKTQNIMIGGPEKSYDWLIVNNAWWNTNVTQPYNATTEPIYSQFTNNFRHVLFAHNTWSNQKVMLGREDSKINPGTDCIFKNNVAAAIRQHGSYPFIVPAPVDVQDNHVFGPAIYPPIDGQGAVAAGDNKSLFADPADGDFAPAGELLSNRKKPIVRFDLQGAERDPAGDAAGAVSIKAGGTGRSP